MMVVKIDGMTQAIQKATSSLLYIAVYKTWIITDICMLIATRTLAMS